jgi:hypothetical protein
MNPCAIGPSGIIFKSFIGYKFSKNIFKVLVDMIL